MERSNDEMRKEYDLLIENITSCKREYLKNVYDKNESRFKRRMKKVPTIAAICSAPIVGVGVGIKGSTVIVKSLGVAGSSAAGTTSGLVAFGAMINLPTMVGGIVAICLLTACTTIIGSAVGVLILWWGRHRTYKKAKASYNCAIRLIDTLNKMYDNKNIYLSEKEYNANLKELNNQMQECIKKSPKLKKEIENEKV